MQFRMIPLVKECNRYKFPVEQISELGYLLVPSVSLVSLWKYSVGWCLALCWASQFEAGLAVWKNASLVHKRCKSPRVGCCDAYHNVWISHLNGFTDSDSVDPMWHQLQLIAGEFQMYFASHGESSMPSPDSMKQIVLDSMRLSPTFSCDRSLLTFYFTLEEWFKIFYV